MANFLFVLIVALLAAGLSKLVGLATFSTALCVIGVNFGIAVCLGLIGALVNDLSD